MSDLSEARDNVIYLDSVTSSPRDELSRAPGVRFGPGCVDIGKLSWYAIDLAAQYKKKGTIGLVPSAFPEGYLRDVEKMVRETVEGVHSIEAKKDGMVVLATRDAWGDKYCFIFWLKLQHLAPLA